MKGNMFIQSLIFGMALGVTQQFIVNPLVKTIWLRSNGNS